MNNNLNNKSNHKLNTNLNNLNLNLKHDKSSLSMSKSEECIIENVSRNLSHDFNNVNLNNSKEFLENKSMLETDNITNRLKSINNNINNNNNHSNANRYSNNFNNSNSLTNTNSNNINIEQSHINTVQTLHMNDTKGSLASLNSTLIKSSNFNLTRSLSKPKRTPKAFNHTLQRINKINDNLTKCNLELTKINSNINDLYFTLNNQDYKGNTGGTNKDNGENILTQEKISKLETKKKKIMKE